MLSSLADTRSGMDRKAVAVLLLCTLAAVALLFLFRATRTEGPPPSPGGEHSAASGVPPAPVPPEEVFEVPSVWPQAGLNAQGNPAWGHPVREPFHLAWELETGYEFFSPPVLLDSVLYIGCNDLRFRAVNAGTGRVLWTHSVVCGLSGGVSGTGDRIWWGGQDGRVICLDRRTGDRLWSTGLGYHVFSDAALFQDTIILAGTSMGSVAALHAETGDLLWNHDLEGLVLGPAVAGDMAVFVTESGRVAAFSSDGRCLWNRGFSSQPSPPSISDSTLYIGFSSGKILAFRLSTGTTLWETPLPDVLGRALISRPVIAGSVILAGTCDDRLVCLDRSTGDILWQAPLENWLQVPPTVCDTLVYAACDDERLHVLSLNTGEVLYSHEMGGYAGTQPIVADGMIFLGTASGRFLALRGTPPDEPSP